MSSRKPVIPIPNGAKIEVGATGELYMHHKGLTVIPQSLRPDGTVRKQKVMRPGYTPIEEQKKFRSGVTSKLKNGVPLGGQLLEHDSDDNIPAKWKQPRVNHTPNIPVIGVPKSTKPKLDSVGAMPKDTMRSGWYSSDEEGQISDEGVHHIYKKQIEQDNNTNEGINENNITTDKCDIQTIEPAPPVKPAKSPLEQARTRLKLLEKKKAEIIDIEERQKRGARLSGTDLETIKKKSKIENDVLQLKSRVEYLEQEAQEF